MLEQSKKCYHLIIICVNKIQLCFSTISNEENFQSVVKQNSQLVSLLQSTVEMQAYLLDKLVSFFIK
jgi:hypothetical protein